MSIEYSSVLYTCVLCILYVCYRLRDLTAQDKLEHQRVVKDLEKAHSDLKQAQETRDKIQTELKVCVCVCVLST